MSGNHKKATIKIDGVKLRKLLEDKTGVDIYTIARDNGFSRNIIAEACRTGYASAVVQNIAKLYGIMPDEYKVVEDPKKGEQLSMNDYLYVDAESIKNAVKGGVTEAIVELLPDIINKVIETVPVIVKEVKK